MRFFDYMSNIRMKKRRLLKVRKATKDRASRTEIFAGCAVLISAASLVFAAHQFTETKRMEKQKPFHEERFQTYVELADTVAKLATLPRGSKESNEAIRQYWQLVYGKVEMLAAEDVRKIIRKSSTWVRECLQEKADSPSCIDVSGNIIAMQVSETVQKSFKRSLQLPLE